jgi:hypothetical protein
MTHEPGTADITTTLDQPFPGPERNDDAVLAELMRELLRGGGLSINPVASVGGIPRWRLALPGGHVMWITDQDTVLALYRFLHSLNDEKPVRWTVKR